MLLRVAGVIVRDITAIIKKDFTSASHPGMEDKADITEDVQNVEGGNS